MRCEVCGRDLNEIWQDNMAGSWNDDELSRY